MAGPSAPQVVAGQLAWAIVSLGAALLLLGVSILPFLTPAWIHFEQDRAGSAAFTGYDAATVSRATDSIVHDLLLGGDFAVSAATPGCQGASACAPVQVLDSREVSHMQDVRGVFQGLALLVLASFALVAGAWLAARRRATWRMAWWRAIGRGGRWLAVFMVVVGVLSVVAFDAAFEVFHELLFPAGSFSFDPRTERLVQLFPDQFWSETSLALGILALALSIAIAVIAVRRASRAGRDVAGTDLAVTASGGPGAAQAALPRRSAP